jgi:site-specific recombinase XerD
MSRIHAPSSCRKSPGATNPTSSNLPLVLPSAAALGSLPEAARLVKEIWGDQAEYAEQTLDRYGALLDRFANHGQAIGLAVLAEVDVVVVKGWINAPGRDRQGRVVKPSARTVNQRRAAVGAFFATAMSQGLTLDDPTPLVPVPEREECPGIRPLDPDEAVDVRFRAGTNPAEVRGVVVSLLLAGARTGELGALERGHVESSRAVRLRGSAHFTPRTISVDAETAGLLAARAAYLAQRYPNMSLLCGKVGKPGSQQSRISTVVRKVLKSAGLDDDPQVKPSSLTAYAAQREFERTGSLEAAAQLIGSRSLDSTARLIGYSWNEASA